MKKLFAILLTVLMLTAVLAGCSSKEQGDVDAITEKGVIVVGITDYAPMDYKEKGSDEWVGFDAELANAVAKKMGVKVEFKEIDWDNKFLELNTRAIDCIWNGMTITDEVKKNTSVTEAYARNRQVVVVKKELASKIKTVDDLKAMKDFTVSVEKGSSGEAVAEDNGFQYTSVNSQADTLLEVNSGATKAAIIDSTMADAMTGEGTDYKDLASTVVLSEEQYGIGCRKDSDLTQKLNETLKELKEDGTMKQLSEKYQIELID